MQCDAQLSMPAGAHAPDPWERSKGVQLPLDHVISRDANGKPLSYVRDLAWDWTFYTARKKKLNLLFWYWRTDRRTVQGGDVTEMRIARIRELQYLLFLKIYRAERPQSEMTLVALLGQLRSIAAFAEVKGCSVRDVLEQADVLDDYIGQMPNSKCHSLATWISFLRTLDPVIEVGFEVAKAKRWAELLQRAKEYRDSQGQHAPLPTRIYLKLINGLDRELGNIEAHIGLIQGVVREAIKLHQRYKAKGWKMGASFGPNLLIKHGLEDLLLSVGVEVDLSGLASLLTHIQRLAKLQIHVFSGMRDEEARYLPYHCMEFENAGHGRKHHLIAGVTTKLAGGRNKRARWVTTEEQGFRAILLAQAIADLIYVGLGVIPSAKESDKDAFPLFVSTGYLPWIMQQEPHEDGGIKPSSSLKISSLPDVIKEGLFAVIEPVDVDELEAIDPFRDWSSEPVFEVGKRWHLKSHQLRRSLALYANASGLVKSSSLRRQLQHITSEMTYYYGRGSVFAKNLLKDDPKGYSKHVAAHWQDSEQEAQYVAFTRDVLNSDEPLWGPGGVFYDLKKQRGEVMSADEVKEQLRMGRMAYKAHPLGGCTNVGACDKQKGLRLTSGICVSQKCKNLIGKHSSIIKVIPIQRGIVARLDPNSIAYAMEREELDILESAEKEWSASCASGSIAAAERGGAHV